MKKSALYLATATLLLTGCATQSFVMDGNKEDMARNDEFFSENITDLHEDADKTKIHHFFLSGIAQGEVINPAQVCGGLSRVVKVETETTFTNALLSIITLGIYTPREARVYCK